MGILTRFFDLRAGESRLVLRTALILFGLIAAHTMLETARDALFLGKQPASQLTLVYGMLAGLSLAVARVNARFVSAFGRRNGLIFTLLAAAFGTVIFYLLPLSPSIVFGLYIWSGLLGTILVVQFWMLAGQNFTVAQGKRLFGPLAAGGVLGAVAGASFAVATLEYIEVRDLMLVAAGLFMATAMVLTGETIDAPSQVSLEEAEEKPRSTIARELTYFKENPYLLRLALLIAISTAAVLVTDFIFKAHTAAQFQSNPEQLGLFFARYYAILNAVALLVQILLASYIVKKAGVLMAFMILPLLLTVGGVATLILGGGAVLLTKGADGSLRHSLHRISSELLWMPLPDYVRARSKGAIDTVVVRGTQAITAGLLLISVEVLPEAYGQKILAGLLLVLTAAWLMMAVALRKPYLDLFRQALNRTDNSRIELDLRSIEIVVESLSSPDPVQAVAAIDLLAANGRSKLIPALILYHDSEEVLEKALEVIGTQDRKDWVPLAERLLEHSSEGIRVASLRALAKAGHHELVETRMMDVSPVVRAHCAYWMAELNQEVAPHDHDDVQMVLQMRGPAGSTAQVGLLEAIKDAGSARWAELLLQLYKTEDKQVALAVVEAMASVQDQRFIPLLLDRLAFRAGRPMVRQAIVALGEEALDALELALFSPDTERHVRRHIPTTIGLFDTQRAADMLVTCLDKETNGRVRFKALRALGHLVNRFPATINRAVLEQRLVRELTEHLRMIHLNYFIELDQPEDLETQQSAKLLTGLLSDKTEQALQRAFLLLQIAHPQEDIRSVALAASSSDKRIHAQAQEFIDALTLNSRDSLIRELFRLTVDDLETKDKVSRAAPHTKVKARDIRESLQSLLREPDEAIASVAAYHAYKLGFNELKSDMLDVSRERPFLDSLKSIIQLLDLEEAPKFA